MIRNKTLRTLGLYPAGFARSASGAAASFRTDAAAPLRSLTVGIDPVQSGSGDPSPDNVRPISGWTGANIYRVGANLWDEQWINGYYQGNTWELTPVPAAQTLACASHIPVRGGTTLCILHGHGTYLSLFQFGPDNEHVLRTYFANNKMSVTLDEATTSIAFHISDYGNGVYYNDVSINHPSTVIDYQPYRGNAYPISWQDEAGTVYGGTLDVTTGELTVTHGNIASYNGETLPGAWISSMDIYTAGGTPTTGAQVVYELAAPITYRLAPVEVQTILGQNNIYADTGDVSATCREGGVGSRTWMLAMLMAGRREA